MAKRTAEKRKVARRATPKRGAPKRRRSEAKQPVPALESFDVMPIPDERAAAMNDASLHDLFQQQTMAMLDRSDLDEEQKQSILVAMNCPCCGGSGLSFTMKLKRKK
ncbi:MAG: hypothetical protein GEU95_19745 [Rhizobiales bacterium]|nr:hypothetical protein [Hyphomicrobiales bacterium]